MVGTCLECGHIAEISSAGKVGEHVGAGDRPCSGVGGRPRGTVAR